MTRSARPRRDRTGSRDHDPAPNTNRPGKDSVDLDTVLHTAVLDTAVLDTAALQTAALHTAVPGAGGEQVGRVPAAAAGPVLRLGQSRDLPASVSLLEAARALGIGRTSAYNLARRGEFPCPLIKVGALYRIPTAGLLRLLGLTPPPPTPPPTPPPPTPPASPSRRVPSDG